MGQNRRKSRSSYFLLQSAVQITAVVIHPLMMHIDPTDVFPLVFINFENPTLQHEEANRYFMIAIITNVCQNYSDFTCGYLEI